MKKRLIPFLTINEESDLVKTVLYKKPNYIGCPINAVKILNDKFCDELNITDIESNFINFKNLEEIVDNCFMPISYTGAVKSVSDVKKLFSIGVEKVFINESSINDESFIKVLCNKFGAQSIGIKVDFKKRLFGGYKTLKTNRDVLSVLELLHKFEFGELIVSDVSNDGKMNGYNLELFKEFKNLSVPVICLGGASDYHDVKRLHELGLDAGASSLFVYHGRLKAILINYKNEF